ncbi:MAG: DNA-protecting protein DprA [Bacteroidales bacterium]|nr:DNA-protecting protein DprA [Bacteroidales bacterium]
MVKGIGPAFIKRNLIRIASYADCTSIVNENKPEQFENIQTYLGEADQIINDCRENGIEIVSILSSDYPSSLKEISDPPSLLFVKGNKDLLKRCIAIIGTRHSSQLGNKIAERLGEYFSKNYAICNGLVEGIDEHSIYVNGQILSNVVGIISGGLCFEETCSKNHTKVINDVLNSGGLIITEYYPHVKEDLYSGSKASRIQAGLSQGLILVQSSIDGGSKYTIASFAKLGRAMGVIHYPSSSEYSCESFGANRLIVEKKIEGIAKIANIKTVSKVNVKSITVLESKEDYSSFVQEISKQGNLLNLGF